MRAIALTAIIAMSAACSDTVEAVCQVWDDDCEIGDDGRDTRCDDGTAPVCDQVPPECDPGSILAYRDSCFVCVNPLTCGGWGVPGCETDGDCTVQTRCDPCATASCPACNDCVPACWEHGCDTEVGVICRAARPDCGDDAVAIVEDGCWSCVALDTCEPI